ncbi:MAG: PadR family transcriptional regulator [Bacteroidota bacterium]
MKRENITAYAILGLLHHEPMTGYDLKKRFENTIGHFWPAGFGQIYPALGGLAREGLIAGRAEEGKTGLAKTVYTLTEAGRAALQRWLAVPAAKEHVRYEILLKLFFGALAPPEQNVQTIREFRRRYERALAVLDGFEADLRRVLNESEDHLYYLLTVRFGQRVYGAYLAWADEALALLAGRNKETGA